MTDSIDWTGLAAAAEAGGSDYLELVNAVQQGGGAYLAALAAQKAQALSGLPGSPGLGTATLGANATSGQFSVGQDAINSVEADYPNLAWLLAIPEVAPLIVQAAQSGMSPEAFQAEFESTGWYKTNSQAVRNWIAEVETDPAQAQSDMQAQESSLKATLTAMGVTYTQTQLQTLAQQSLAMGWTDQQVKDTITGALHANADGTYTFDYGSQSSTTSASQPGTLQGTMDQITAEAAKYLVPISQSTVQSFAMSMANGSMDATGLDAYMQAQATSLYPSIAGAIKAGITPSDYVTPYKEVAAQLLGVNPNSIDMTQQKWNRALSAPGQGGVPQAMSLYDWQQLLMRDPQYNYMNSINAKDRASSIAQGLGEMFGKAPSGPSGSTAFSSAGAPRIAGVPIS